MHPARKAFTMSLCALISACQSARPPITTEAHVDLSRFMGDWYVIANIPTSLERDAHNAVESYRLEDDGSITTTFTFREAAFDGDVKRYCIRGFVRDVRSNAVWGMRFVWPFTADYRIVFLSVDNQLTIIGRQKRDHVWVMARTPQVSEAQFADLRDRVAREGYDMSGFGPVPQRWPEDLAAPPRGAAKSCP